ncbi:hypothetical protein Q6A86_01990 [Aliarcobacter skirrowii]|uniref:hypothetical protein n=1 Tax=Aliarcobacter skirrowii TaxID=28200 RepID=UPI0029A86098|nr:hypothetical protein [Aliarcobacter skirrowii]MDX4011748.1 hypothetical protein [Aliarcobacter skirrowii]
MYKIGKYTQKIKPYFEVYSTIFKIFYKMNRGKTVKTFILFNIGFLASLGIIIIFTKIIELLMSDSLDNISIFLVGFLFCLLAEVVFTHFANINMMQIAISLQKKIHSLLIVNNKGLELERHELKQLANRGARLSGQSVDDIFLILNYSVYSVILSLILLYLSYKIFFIFLIVLFLFLPLIYKTKRNTNKISNKFFGKATSTFAKENNTQMKSEFPSVDKSSFKYFFKVFYNYKIINERMSFVMKFMQAMLLVILLIIIVYEISNQSLTAMQGLIFIFVIKNFGAYVSSIIASITNLLKYYSGLKGVEVVLQDIR